jgi:hypothetical protein
MSQHKPLSDAEPDRMYEATWPREGEPWPVVLASIVCVTEYRTSRPMAWEWIQKRGGWVLADDAMATHILAAWAVDERSRAKRAAEEMRERAAGASRSYHVVCAHGCCHRIAEIIEALPTEPER